MPASGRHFFVASAASQSGLFPGTLPTGDIPMPTTATLPRRVALRTGDIEFLLIDVRALELRSVAWTFFRVSV
jgi:hypothetical protein